jgi:hypothetical protein
MRLFICCENNKSTGIYHGKRMKKFKLTKRGKIIMRGDFTDENTF